VPSAKNEAKIRFTAETSEFNQALRDANSDLSSLRAEMKLAEAQFKNTGDEAEYQKQKLELLEASLQANHDKQEALTSKLEVAKQIYGEDSEEVAKLERALTYAKTEEQNLLNQVNDTNGGMDAQKEAAEGAGNAMDDVASILVNAGIADKIREIGEAAIDMAGDFSEASATIVEGTGASGEALEDLNRQAQDAFGRIADADADLNSISSILAELNTRFGLTGDAAEDMTVKIQQFAQHTGTDGTKAVDSIADIMHRWGLDIEDVDGLLDDLTTANQSCQMSVDDLTGYLTKNSTQFQELGYSTEDALALLISLSDGGANVSNVMSGLTKGVSNLSGVTDDVPGAFRDAVQAISEAGSVSEALQAQVGDTGKTVEEIFGKKAAQELATNIQNGSFAVEDWTSVLQANEGALQSTAENATTMQDAWSQATNNVSLALGSTFAPAISAVVTQVAEVISKVAQVVQDSPALQAIIVGVAVALGILATALAISAIIQGVTTAFGLLNTVLLANPIFLVITAIAALVAALIFAYNNCETFRAIVDNAFTMIKNVAVNVFNSVQTTITNVFNAIRSIAETIRGTLSNVWNSIRSTASSVWNGIRSTASSVWNGIKDNVINPIRTAYDNVTSKFSDLKSKIDDKINDIKSKVESTFNSIREKMESPIETAKNTIDGIISTIKGWFPFSLGRIVDNIELPHFSISGEFSLNPPSIPHINVDWWASGAVFNKATLIPTINGVHGVGEAGPEAVSPISVLQEYVGSEVRRNVPQIDYDLMADKVAGACARMNISIDVDKRQIGRVVREVQTT